MQQKHEIPFSDLTMEDRAEVRRVIQLFSLPHPASRNDVVREKFVAATDGGFQINFVTEPERPPVVEVMFEGGHTFYFQPQLFTCTLDEATRLFNDFIENNLDAANDCATDHPEWFGLDVSDFTPTH